MAFIKEIPVGQVVVGGVTQIPLAVEDVTLVGFKLRLTGTTFNRSHIEKIKIKCGAKTVWELTLPQLLAINAYKGEPDNARYLQVNFAERTQAIFPVKEIGGFSLYDLAKYGQTVIELTVAPTAVAPRIVALGTFEARQPNDMILKFVPFPLSQATGGQFPMPLPLRGAMVKRIYFFYTGTAWTPTTNGNFSKLLVKKNGYTLFDEECQDVRFDQSQFRKIPQQNCFVWDAIVDDNHDAHVTTVRKNPQGGLLYDTLEFIATLADAGGSQITAVVECLDMVPNL